MERGVSVLQCGYGSVSMRQGFSIGMCGIGRIRRSRSDCLGTRAVETGLLICLYTVFHGYFCVDLSEDSFLVRC